MRFLRVIIKRPEKTQNRAQADAGEGLGRSQGGEGRQRKENGLKSRSTGFIQSLFGPVSK